MPTPTPLWNLPASLPHDLEKFQSMTAQFKSGEISPTQFLVFRVPQGVYEQRESGTYMLRVRLPGGVALPHQLRALAEASRRFGNGVLHVTTRQDIQIHQVAVDDIQPALELLAAAGLSTKGGGGNTVRNITGCPNTGVCRGTRFNVTPHVIALTEGLLNDPKSFQLPRKYKIAFSACGTDCGAATVQDLGFIAKTRDGKDHGQEGIQPEHGFTVYVGGGLGGGPRLGDLLEEFVPASDAPLIAEAIKRVFYQHGNRKDKRQARIRFLVRQLGFEKFVELYRGELAEVRREVAAGELSFPEPRPLRLPPTVISDNASAFFNAIVGGAPADSGEPDEEPDASLAADEREAFRRWKNATAILQRQPGYYRVEAPLVLGDIPAENLTALADVAEAHGERAVRATITQNLNFRWIHSSELVAFWRKLAALGLAEPQPPVLSKLVTCTGAATCKLGICLSRGLAKAVAARLGKSGLDLTALGQVTVHISGCPNSCGRHQLADIGLHGAARRAGERLVPHYTLQFGGRTGEGRAALAQGRHTLPARAVPAFLADLLAEYGRWLAEKSGVIAAPVRSDFHAFLNSGGLAAIDTLAEKHKAVPDFDEDKNFYYDWGSDELFSLAGRGPGECGAGVFDLIDVDLNSADAALADGHLFKAAALAARALLVTRGEQAQTDRNAFALFQTHFVQAGLADAKFTPLLEAGVRAANIPDAPAAFAAELGGEAALKTRVAEFVAAVAALFAGMDASLQFPKRAGRQGTATPATPQPAPQADSSACAIGSAPVPVIAPAAPLPAADAQKDFRGVVCPLNYVKTKMALTPLKPGQVLSILLDEAGARNVPESSAKDGHELLAVTPEATPEGPAWRVVIRKK